MLVELKNGMLMNNLTGEIVGYVRPDGTTVWADGYNYDYISKMNRCRLNK